MREAAAAADLGNRSRVHQPIRSESRDHGQPIRGDVCVFFLLEGVEMRAGAAFCACAKATRR